MKKNYTLDVFRVACALLVALQHVPVYYEQLYDIPVWYFFTQMLGRIAVPYFFTISGYFFIKALQANRNVFLKQVKRIGMVYCVWTIIYLPIIFKNYGFLNIKVVLKEFFIYGSSYQLWYIPALVFAYIVITVMHKCGVLKYFSYFCLCLYAIGVLCVAYGQTDILKNIEILQHIISYKHFNIFRRFVLFGLPLFSMGYFIDKINEKISNKKVYIATVVFLVLFFIEQLAVIRTNGKTIMTFTLYPFILCIFVLCLRFPSIGNDRLASVCRIYSNLLYFAHVLIYEIVSNIAIINPVLFFLLAVFVVIPFVYVIYKYPKSIFKYLC